MVARKTLWEWKRGKSIPKPKTLKKIKNGQLREEAALLAIKNYLKFVSKEKLLLELMKENNNE
jgi:hypothetical protein